MAVETYRRIRINGGRLRQLQLGVLLRKGSWGLGDQALISASNFITTVVLARSLSFSDFGAFALLYGAIFLTISLQTTLITRPHNVLGATRQGAEYRRYTTVTAVSQLCFTGFFALVTLIAAVAARGAAGSFAPLLFALAPAVAAWQLQEFTRRVLYTEGRFKDAFINDLISCGGQAVAIVVLGHFNELTAVRAFAIIALTSALAATWGCWQIREALDRHGVWRAVRAHGFGENWHFGKWLFGAALATWISSQLYPILIGGLISVAEAGAFSAVLTLMGPARILLIAMDTALAPVAARAYAEKGQPALHSFVVRILMITAPAVAVYCIGVSLFAKTILGAAYGEHYRAYGWLLALFAIGYALDYLRHPVSIALEARRASAPIFRAYLAAGVVVLTAGVAAVHFLGLLGAALGTITSSLILGVMIWHYYRHPLAIAAPRAQVGPLSWLPEIPLSPVFDSERARSIPRSVIDRRPARDTADRADAKTREIAERLVRHESAPAVAMTTRTRYAARARGVARSAVIPLWEKGFAVAGIFLCLDAGVRTIRILSGTESPIQSVTAEVDYSQGSALTQILLFSVYLVSIMLLLIQPTRQVLRGFKPKLLWLLPTLAMFSVLWSGAPSISFRRAVALLGSSIFGLYLATRYSRTDLLRLFLTVSVIATVLTVLTAIALPAYAIDAGAWLGVFGQKNHLGRFMALSAVLWLLYGLSHKRHRLLAALTLVSVVLVLLSHSATSVVLLFTLVAVLLLVRLMRLPSGLAVPILALLAVGGGYLALRVASDPSQVTSLLGRDSSLTGRTQLWGLVWQMIRTHSGFGFGYGGFWLGFDGPSAPVWVATGWNPPSAHDGFLDLMLDLGFVGMAIFIPAMLIALRYAFALARRGRTLDSAFPLIFLVFYLMSNITESYLVAYNTESWVLFVAITIQLYIWWQEEGSPRARAHARTHARMPARTMPHDDLVPRPALAAMQKERSIYQEGRFMPAQVTVSAIMTTDNAMPYVKDAIDSVLAQTFTDWDLVIVDTGSTDGTRALLAEYTDPRIRIIEAGETRSRAAARNIALNFACGKYIAITESNARSLPERFAKEVAQLESHPEIHVVSSQVMQFAQNGPPRSRSAYPEETEAIQRRFAKGKMAIPFPAAMIRSWCFDRFDNFSEDLERAEELEWFLRIRQNCNFRVLPDALCLYRHQTGGGTFRQWIGDLRYEQYAAYRAKQFGANADRRVLSFDQFSRRWQARLGYYTWDAVRFAFRSKSDRQGPKRK